jgi:thiamine kinase-like enzyme
MPADALVRIPAALRTLHTLAPFPSSPFNTTCTFRLNQGPALDGFLEKFRTSSILPEKDTQELLAGYRQVAAVCSRLESDWAPSHNDLFKPDNMLFDGKRLWLVDWEAASQNDRYADLAVVANMIVSNESEETIYLQEYFGKAADGYERARFYLMRQLANMFYAMAFPAPASSASLNEREAVPAYNDFQRRFWAREAGLSDTDARTVYGRVQWEQLSQNMRQTHFHEALRMVSERETRSGAVLV